MPTLNWIGKEKVVNHHMDVPYRPLKKKYTFNAKNSDNMIIHGDNLEALKALLPKYEGKIDVIYIDPPYNTGNEGWVYNDNVNDPRIRRWLGQVVGQEGEDLSRHDKWLCMMYPRLMLLQKLLSDKGILFISIDDNEYANLKIICDEVLGCSNFVTNIIWLKKTGSADSVGVSTITEYVLVYVKSPKGLISFKRNTESYDKKRYRHKDEYFNERGPFYYDSLGRGSIEYSDAGNYAITAPDGTEIYPNDRCEFVRDGWTWKWSKEKVEWGLKNGFIDVSPSSTSKTGWSVRYKIYLNVDNEGKPTQKSTPFKNVIDFALNADAAANIKSIFDGNNVFKYSKPVNMIQWLIGLHSNQDAIVLDAFAGSGTTAHAMLNLNKEDGGNRKFILCEMCDYAESITAERVRRVINGYGKDNKAVPGTDGDFSFYELGEPIVKDGNINPDVTVEELRKFIYYSETRTDLPEANPDDPTLLGVHNGVAFYLHYSVNCCTILDRDYLRTLKTKADSYVIYAGRCTLSEAELEKFRITFRKTSRDVRAF